jgi:hypothetical protein
VLAVSAQAGGHHPGSQQNYYGVPSVIDVTYDTHSPCCSKRPEAAGLPIKDKARRIAANVAKLPELL